MDVVVIPTLLESASGYFNELSFIKKSLSFNYNKKFYKPTRIRKKQEKLRKKLLSALASDETLIVDKSKKKQQQVKEFSSFLRRALKKYY